MAANLYKNQSYNVRKTWALMSVFLVIVIFLGWFLSLYYGNPGILYFAFGFSLLTNFFSYWFSDKIVLKMAGANEINRDTHYELYNIVENLSITAGLPTPKIYIIEDEVPNAFATGRDKNHAAVAFSSGLLKILNKTELEGVAAHELAHIGNRDILLQTIVVVLVGFITLIADLFLRMSLHGDRDNKLSGIILVAGIVLTILSPIIATLIQLAISRKREFLADSTGALLTRYPEGLASALEKISGHSGKMKKANHAMAHLYISNPFGKKANNKISLWQKIFMTHPPVNERTAALRGMRVE